MPADDEAITARKCWAPPDMTRAVDLPAATLERLVIEAGRVALGVGDVVTVLGARSGLFPTGHFCRHDCRYSHHGSVLVLPDTTVVELFANGGVLHAFQHVDMGDGASVAIAAVMLPPPDVSVRPSS